MTVGGSPRMKQTEKRVCQKVAKRFLWLISKGYDYIVLELGSKKAVSVIAEQVELRARQKMIRFQQ